MAEERRFTFDDIASLYDRSRPGYPSSLFDELIEIAGLLPGGSVLEIGCGTGQATRDLVERGLSVVAVEPGPELGRLAARNLAGFDVDVRCETFEEAALEAESFDLVFSAQAFHWIPPDLAYAKSRRLLRPGGALAVIGNVEAPGDGPVWRAIESVYHEHAPSLAGPPVTRWYAPEGPLEASMAKAEGFGPPQVRSFPWVENYSADRYADLLRTHSGHQLLAADSCDALLGAVAAVIEAHGGSIDVAYEANLYVAQRAGRAGVS